MKFEYRLSYKIIAKSAFVKICCFNRLELNRRLHANSIKSNFDLSDVLAVEKFSFIIHYN